MSDETWETAELMHQKGLTEVEARVEYLSSVLGKVREGARLITTSVFRIHPDDLES